MASLLAPPAQPVPPGVIDDIEDGGDAPADGIAHQHGLQHVAVREDQQHPQHPQHTHAAAGKKHGLEGVACTPDRAGEDLNADEGDVEGDGEPHDMPAQGDDRAVGGEHTQQDGGRAAEEEADEGRHTEGDAQADHHALLEPVVLPGTEVLAHKGGDGYAEGAGDHPIKAVHLAESGPGGHGDGAERVDAGLKHHVGDGVHIGLNARREPDAQDAFEFVGVETDGAEVYAVDRARLEKGDGHQHGAHHLGQYGGQPHTEDGHVQHHHKEQVQHDVGEACGDEKVEGTLGIADGAEDAGPHIVDERGHGPAEVDPQVGERVAHHVLRGTHHAKDRAGKGDAHACDDHARRQGQGDAGMDGLPQVFSLPGAVILGDDHCGPGGEAHKEVHQKVDEHRCGAAYRAQGGGTHKVPHDDGVHRVVELLEKGAQQDGKEK